MQHDAPPPILSKREKEKEGKAAALLELQSVNLWQAFFQRQAVHHMSRFSIPYTLRHFLPSPRTFRLQTTGAESQDRWDG